MSTPRTKKSPKAVTRRGDSGSGSHSGQATTFGRRGKRKLHETFKHNESIGSPSQEHWWPQIYGETMEDPPNGLPSYRLLTGKGDTTFCERVSEALSLGYKLHGSPAICFNGQDVIAAQAIVWPTQRRLYNDDEIPF